MTSKEEPRVWHNISGAQSWDIPQFGTETRSDKDATSSVEEEVEPAPPTAEELHALQKKAYDEAYAQGHAQGLADGQQAIDAAIERLRIIAAELASPLDELDRDLEYSLANLALILARRIVGKAVREDAESLHALVQQTVAVLGKEIESEVDVYLNSEDMQFLSTHLGDDVPWRLHADATLQSGDVRVKRGLAEVDGRLEQRLDRLASEMLHG